MTAKTLKKLVTREGSKYPPSIYGLEQWWDDAWKKPYSLFGPSFDADVCLADRCEISLDVDLYEYGNEIVMSVDLPGVKREDIKIDISENILTLSGEKKRFGKVEKEYYFRYERGFGTFLRRFILPFEMDTEKVVAHFEDGVLCITIPVLEAGKIHKMVAVH